jgi:hypothetical protein
MSLRATARPRARPREAWEAWEAGEGSAAISFFLRSKTEITSPAPVSPPGGARDGIPWSFQHLVNLPVFLIRANGQILWTGFTRFAGFFIFSNPVHLVNPVYFLLHQTR